MERTKRAWLVGGAAALALGGLASLVGGGEDGSTADEAKRGPRPSATESVDPDGWRAQNARPRARPTPSARGGGVPSPDPVRTARLLRALGAVEPGLTADEDRAVRRARAVCRDLRDGKRAETVRANARTRYEDGAVPRLTDEQAGRIVAAVRSVLCGPQHTARGGPPPVTDH
ncbi:DUF732 domain-containing protein [Streptomyces sp. G45]|uniref:DUF732 domain-containing protein n=1 Tax=Streptomyces sp. G45 TaxID=3406627 RepID=UPI003C2A5138